MATMTEVEKLAFDLPDSDRAVLAAHLLRSLPSVLHDEDEGVAEALRRDAELDAKQPSNVGMEILNRGISQGSTESLPTVVGRSLRRGAMSATLVCK